MSKPKPHNVLIVDDVAKNIQLVASFLQEAGYEINFALNGKMAIEHAQSQPLDLILLDIMMPDMDGFQVCEVLKQNAATKEIPIIFLTAKTDVDSITKAFSLGGVDYITKPFNRQELLARVKTHLQLKDQRMALEEMNATKNKFFSIIAHDLKSPLNQLLGLSNLMQQLLDHEETEELQKVVKLMHDSARRGKDLLDSLLEWSRAQLDSARLEPAAFNVRQMAEEVVQLMGPLACEKKISMDISIDATIEAYGDRNMITTVLRNLISNAIKFTEQNGSVKISARKQRHMVEVEIKDDGIGMHEQDVSKLFRLDVNPITIGKSKQKGTGLGLIISKEFVEKNGGSISAQSEDGKGSAFIFTMTATEAAFLEHSTPHHTLT
jgi:signal transduction histidine kinase